MKTAGARKAAGGAWLPGHKDLVALTLLTAPLSAASAALAFWGIDAGEMSRARGPVVKEEAAGVRPGGRAWGRLPEGEALQVMPCPTAPPPGINDMPRGHSSCWRPEAVACPSPPHLSFRSTLGLRSPSLFLSLGPPLPSTRPVTVPMCRARVSGHRVD